MLNVGGRKPKGWLPKRAEKRLEEEAALAALAAWAAAAAAAAIVKGEN